MSRRQRVSSGRLDGSSCLALLVVPCLCPWCCWHYYGRPRSLRLPERFAELEKKRGVPQRPSRVPRTQRDTRNQERRPPPQQTKAPPTPSAVPEPNLPHPQRATI